MTTQQTDSLSWKTIWQQKGTHAPNQLDLTALIDLNGWHSCKNDTVSVDDWTAYVKKISTILPINQHQSILEVGCGAGAFLFPLYQNGMHVFGADYSDSLLQIAAKIMPAGNFTCTDASALPFSNHTFDVIVSNGVFNYFDDLTYAKAVMLELMRTLKKNGRAAILEINDADKKDDFEEMRRKKNGGL